ncbi:MAG: bifunctional demethylmenaquinone methyltransferase/2-methoxy-6-polyprenyl-1,4-benzoquinol methylase UbiE [Clostridia bacterium]|nr:MAG: bifunctional demethylmenaquinone methyltransferase/2-methoxy-6-polyprenyl-1,4-benzoquinol methylase UbiE [Clostridia bacterium]
MVHEVFATIARQYDRMNSLLSFGRDKGWRQRAVDILAPGAADTVLDVCCGTAMLSLEVAKRLGPQGKVIGIDFSPEMLAVGERNLRANPLGSRVELVPGDALELPFPDDSFDSAVSAFALRNLTDVVAAMAEMRRVVRPGGRIVILELAKPSATVFQRIYYFYFYHLVPLIGRVAVGRSLPYSWLPESVRIFPSQAEVQAMLSMAGLVNTSYQDLTLGTAAIYWGTKPERPRGLMEAGGDSPQAARSNTTS